ncbi:MAG: rhomboid family intramembrane serine protease, partial [Ruminococcus sp.]|nr:rhomboid family intramembrane serine protease [Ruminococcus sp.]
GTTAIITAVINGLFFSYGIIGASGIVFMLIILSSFANAEKGKIPLSLILVAICYLGTEVFNGIFAKDNISQFAHIAGGVMGIIWGLIMQNRKVSV